MQISSTLKRLAIVVAIGAAIGAAIVITFAIGTGDQSGITRTVLQQHALSSPGREALQVRIDFPSGATSPRHTHPGEELIFVLRGTLEYQVGNDPPVTLRSGDVLFVPAGVAHSAINVGNDTGSELATYIVEEGRALRSPAR